MPATPVVEAISREWKRLLDFDCPPAGLSRHDLDFRIKENRSGYSLKFRKRLFGAMRKIALTDPTVPKTIRELYFATAKRAKSQGMVTVPVMRRNEAHLWSVFCYLIGRALNHFESMVRAMVVAEQEAENRAENEKKLVVALNKDIIKESIRRLVADLGIAEKIDGIASHYGRPEKNGSSSRDLGKKYFAKVYWKGRRGAHRKTQGCGSDPDSALADLKQKLGSALT